MFILPDNTTQEILDVKEIFSSANDLIIRNGTDIERLVNIFWGGSGEQIYNRLQIMGQSEFDRLFATLSPMLDAMETEKEGSTATIKSIIDAGQAKLETHIVTIITPQDT